MASRAFSSPGQAPPQARGSRPLANSGDWRPRAPFVMGRSLPSAAGSDTHGFEGLAWLREPLEAHCLAVADGPDSAVPVLDLYAASAPAPPHCRYDGDAVARIDEPLDIHPEVADSLVQLAGDGSKSLDARSGSR